MNQGLVIDNLCHRFHTENGQTVDALNHLSLEVPAGQIVSVIGASGCGKSTLLSLIAGFDCPTQGEITMDGMSVVGKPSPDRCLVFQSPALFEWLTVLQNVMYGLKRQGVSRQDRRAQAMDMLARVGLSGFEKQYPHELSGGMQQRVALARALVMRPRVLLMDEPFAALDAQLRQQMQQLVRSLWRELGQTILFVTHDIREAVAVAHRVVVLTPRPGTVKAVFPVPGSMENREAFLHTGAYETLCAQIGDTLFDR